MFTYTFYATEVQNSPLRRSSPSTGTLYHQRLATANARTCISNLLRSLFRGRT